MPAAPIFFQNQWPAVAAQALTANGGADGLVSVADTSGFKVTQVVKLANNAPRSELFQVLEIISDTQMYVGALVNTGDRRYRANGADVSAYTTATASTIEALQQNKRLPTPQSVLQTVLDPEPVGALRTQLVNPRGGFVMHKGVLKTLRASAIMTTSYVASSALDTVNANAVIVLTDVTKGSATGAFLKFEISDDGTTWYPAETIDNGAASVSGDESRVAQLHKVHTLTPSGVSLTRFMNMVSRETGGALAAFFRASVLSNGADPSSSLVAVKAYACIL